jgi:DNA-binding transcriptional regulator GbsR (MarR family)
MKVDYPKEVKAFADEIGNFIQYWGFKKIHGQIWANLYLSDVPLDANTLIARLKVSKALISISLKDLLEYDVVIPAGKGESSTQTYVANPQIVKVILSVLRQRELKMMAQIESAFKILSHLPKEKKESLKISDTRLNLLGKSITRATSQLQNILRLASIDLKGWTKIPYK